MTPSTRSSDELATSVALATYNGADYLEEQLESILSGTLAPDEIVICDDRSSDATAALVQRVADRHDVPIRFHVNEQRLRSTDNFARAIGLCRGDIIFLSDQDDIWHPQKIERMLPLFADAGTMAVFSDAELIDEHNVSLGTTMFAQLPLTPDHIERLNRNHDPEIVMNRAFVTGAALAFRRELVPWLTPIPKSDFFIHDRWIAIVAAAVAGIRAVPEPLIRYRQHPGQQLGGPQKWRAAAKADSAGSTFDATLAGRLRFYREVRELLAGRPGLRQDPAFVAMLDQGVEHLERRHGLGGRGLGRAAAIVRELRTGRYERYSTGIRSAVKDLLAL